MAYLLTADLHLSDRPKDSYRWGLFPWLSQMQAKHNVAATFLLGDLTQEKDKHSAALVNRLVDELLGLRPPIFILKGNHDFIDARNPFFRFLSTIEGVQFITEPTLINEVAMIPHQPDQASLDKACGIVAPSTELVFGHQCLTGAIAETGTRLTGLAWPLIGQKQPRLDSYSGDIHRPQRLANGVTYVGSPFPIRFGDDYTCRVLLLRNGHETNLYYPCLKKWVLTIQDEDDLLDNEDLRNGDQVRLIVEMTREEVCEWSAHRSRVLAACKELGLEVYGCELKVGNPQPAKRIALKAVKGPQEVFDLYCQAEKVPSQVKKAGSELL